MVNFPTSPENESFYEKKSNQFNKMLHEELQGHLYKKLGLATIKCRRWLKKLCCFYKVKNNVIPSYLAELTL